jgi:hypothetical protein
MRRVAPALLSIGLLLGLPGVAGGQTASEIAAAKQWFTDGLALEEKGEFARALELFRRAAAVKKTPQILFHVGLCEARTGALVEAIVSFERAIESAREENIDQVVAAAESELGKVRPRVGKLRLAVAGKVTPTQLTLDGNPLSPAALEAPIPMNPGRHEVAAEFPSGTARRSFEVQAGKQIDVSLSPPASAEPPAPVPAPRPPEPVSPPGSPAPAADTGSATSALPWLVIGGGVLATAGGFYMWKLRGDQIDALDSVCPAPDSCPADRESEVDELTSKGKTYTTLGVAFFGVGAAALATGGYLLLSGSGAEQRPGARVAPALGPGLAGAVVRGRF